MKIGKYKSEWDPWGSLYFPDEEKETNMTEDQQTTTVSGAIAAIHGCEVCHKLYADSAVVKVEGIEYQMWKRVFPWYICRDCAGKIHDALK